MKLVKPFVKWAGGKGSLISQLKNFYPFEIDNIKIDKYVEPFVGGGAVLINILQKYDIKEVYAFDINMDLINCYNVIKSNVEELIEELEKKENSFLVLENKEREEYFYKIREEYNSYNLSENDINVKRASEFIFLNRTCFNGLYRVNSKNQFNVPYGNYSNPKIVDEELINSISDYLNSNEINIMSGDFEESLNTVKEGDFVYFDPPYIPLNETSSFTSYTHEGFSYEDQVRLRDTVRKLTEKGVKVMVSNSSSELTIELYREFNIHYVDVTRTNGAKSTSRGVVKEVIITNY